VWPGVAIAAFFVNAPIGPTLFTAAGVTAGNTLAPLLAVVLLQRMGFRLELDRLRDALAIVFVGALSVTVSATGGSVSLLLSGSVLPSGFWATWFVWWTGLCWSGWSPSRLSTGRRPSLRLSSPRSWPNACRWRAGSSRASGAPR